MMESCLPESFSGSIMPYLTSLQLKYQRWTPYSRPLALLAASFPGQLALHASAEMLALLKAVNREHSLEFNS